MNATLSKRLDAVSSQIKDRAAKADRDYVELGVSLVEHPDAPLPPQEKITKILAAAGRTWEDLQWFCSRRLPSRKEAQEEELPRAAAVAAQADAAKGRMIEIAGEISRIHKETDAALKALDDEYAQLVFLYKTSLANGRDIRESAERTLKYSAGTGADWADWRNASPDKPGPVTYEEWDKKTGQNVTKIADLGEPC
jgi:hypothetical protein